MKTVWQHSLFCPMDHVFMLQFDDKKNRKTVLRTARAATKRVKPTRPSSPTLTESEPQNAQNLIIPPHPNILVA